TSPVHPRLQDGQPIREIGEALFTALLGTGEVGGLYRASAALAVNRGQMLRVVLRMDSPALADLPWEAMFDKGTESYLCRQAQLIRHVPVPVAALPPQASLPLRILGVISAPRGMVALNVEEERSLLETALAQPIADGLVEMVWAPSATWDDLLGLLLAGPWHALHYIGHGNFDPAANAGILALTKKSGHPDLIEADQFADLLRQARPAPRLVVLNCCSSATSGSGKRFAGTAYSLARSGIPAVVAMQFQITDKAANAFARGFYTAIAQRRGIDDAVSAGRLAILGTRRGTMEWLTPALFLRGDSAQLFARAAPAVSGLEPRPVRTAAPIQAANGTGASRPPGHVFISYSSQDSTHADQLQNLLEAADLRVWRDTDDLWFGQDWRGEIRKAITSETLIFLACFSRASLAQVKSRQNEELVLAIDELRQRRPGITWLIPVRFDACEIPDLDIGGGRTLSSIMPVDLFGDRLRDNGQRLVKAIQRTLAAR
ncbi:MAG TPA: CHAT domain-containing protein, partial [Streptosporangiaceae bacterium]|nr:CHAT domain-containing protein [Streptosporangiaceae bacterium]